MAGCPSLICPHTQELGVEPNKKALFIPSKADVLPKALFDQQKLLPAPSALDTSRSRQRSRRALIAV
jgi:hypothetical protein